MGPKPRIILGAMTFGPEGSMSQVHSLDVYKQALDMFQTRGYDEIDTARAYASGQQEAWTREAGWKDRGLTVATKVYPTSPGIHKADVLTEQFNTSLKELGTDCVDVSSPQASFSCM